MNRKQFIHNKDPLVLIVSIDISSGKTLYDTYDWETYEAWLEEIKEDFPNMITFFKLNKSAIKERKKLFNFTN